MLLSDFDFDLPDELIAQHPPEKRGNDRLLIGLPNRPLEDARFENIIDEAAPGDVFVFNNTKVMKARLFGKKDSGGKVEILIERITGPMHALAHIRASKSPKAGTALIVADNIELHVAGRHDDLFLLDYAGPGTLWDVLAAHGALPLPPYITRQPDREDEQRYQTVYAKHPGAVAAPTAGLHFTEPLLQKLCDKGVIIAEVTLHVGAGTFQPVRVGDIAEHKMHSEWYSIDVDTVAVVEAAKARGNLVWAVGTTSVRTLESAAQSGQLQAGSGDTDIFITPGFEFRVTDRLITNFHLPRSTLLMLVSALSGSEEIKALYRHAVEEKYRFFSYGDAVLLGNKRCSTCG